MYCSLQLPKGVEEIASQVANITDWATGVRPDLNPMEGAFESFVYGAGGGAQFSAMSLPAYGAKVANKVKTGYDFRKASKEFSSLFEDESVDDVGRIKFHDSGGTKTMA